MSKLHKVKKEKTEKLKISSMSQQVMTPFVVCQQLLGILQVLFWLPRCLKHWEALPVHQVLGLSPHHSMPLQALYFILISFFLNEDRRTWRWRNPSEWLQQSNMEYWMQPTEGIWHVQSICHITYPSQYFKWSNPLGCQLPGCWT